jgi:hypothetical protein
MITEEYADYCAARLEDDAACDALHDALERVKTTTAAREAAFDRWIAAGGKKERVAPGGVGLDRGCSPTSGRC